MSVYDRDYYQRTRARNKVRRMTPEYRERRAKYMRMYLLTEKMLDWYFSKNPVKTSPNATVVRERMVR